MTFAARRTWIEAATQVRMILADDNYEEVDESLAFPGDVVVYLSKGDIEHSGVVIRLDDFGSLHILSKWGPYHEVVHKVRDCPYNDCERCV